MSNVRQLPQRHVEADTVVLEPWSTIDEVCEHFKLKPRFIYEHMKKGLPHRHFGRALRFRLSEVEAYLLDGQA